MAADGGGGGGHVFSSCLSEDEGVTGSYNIRLRTLTPKPSYGGLTGSSKKLRGSSEVFTSLIHS